MAAPIENEKEETLALSEPERAVDACDAVIEQPPAVDETEFLVRDPHENKKSNIGTMIFCAVSIVLTFVAMYLASDLSAGKDARPLAEVLKDINVKYLLISLGTILLMMFLDSMKYVVIMWAQGVRVHYPTALKVAFLGKYYDNITPFSSGGQPMQIYYLHKKGLHGGQSFGLIFVKMAFNMAMWLAICLALMVFNRQALITYVASETQLQTFTVFGWIGFGVNCLLPLGILMFVIFPRMTTAVVRWVLHVGAKLKLVKDEDALFLRTKRGVQEFASSFKRMLKKPIQSLILTVLCIAEPLLGMILPYFVIVALGGSAITPGPELMFAIMTLNVYVTMSATIIPTPGNMGGVETAFMLALTTIAEGTLFWTVLGWRFLSFYSYIIIGLVMTVFQMVRKTSRKQTLLQD